MVALSLDTEGKKDVLIERILSYRAQPQEQPAEVLSLNLFVTSVAHLL